MSQTNKNKTLPILKSLLPPFFYLYHTDIDNDAVLGGVDSATEKSINGPRVTNLVAAFVNRTPQRYQTFLTVVRCVRKWAKARGLYSNKMGYWGGVNINIAVAQCLQLYPQCLSSEFITQILFGIQNMAMATTGYAYQATRCRIWLTHLECTMLDFHVRPMRKRYVGAWSNDKVVLK